MEFSLISAEDFKFSLNLHEKTRTQYEDDHSEPECCLCPLKPVPQNLENLRIELLQIACSSYSPLAATQNDALFTVFYKLIPGYENFYMKGEHWMTIGFQSNDPTRDFRAAGLLQVYLLLLSEEKRLRKLFQNSQKLTTPFPFCLVTINITVRLNNLVLRNPRRFYILKAPVEEIFLDCIEIFSRTWEDCNLNITTSGTALGAVESFLKSSKVLI